MPEPTSISPGEQAPLTVASQSADAGALSAKAIFRGVVIGAGGAMVLSTIIGVTAVLGMAGQGISTSTIVGELRSEWDMRGFLVAAELLTAMLGGYAAAVTARGSELRHALFTGAGTLGVSLLIAAICGSPMPAWVAAVSLTLVVPCATLGGYLAAPRCEPAAKS